MTFFILIRFWRDFEKEIDSLFEKRNQLSKKISEPLHESTIKRSKGLYLGTVSLSAKGR